MVIDPPICWHLLVRKADILCMNCNTYQWNCDFSSSVAYPQTDPTTTSYAFQAGLAATINCQIMPGRLSQYYSIRWMNGSLTIATSTPRTSSRSVLPGYQLHDNFSLTINDAQPSDSSTSYRCSVTIDDPQISGTDNIIYGQLSSITVNVYGKTCLHRQYLSS